MSLVVEAMPDNGELSNATPKATQESAVAPGAAVDREPSESDHGQKSDPNHGDPPERQTMS